MSHQDGLGNNRSEPTRSTKPDDDNDGMQKKSENVAHAEDGIGLKKLKNSGNLRNSPPTPRATTGSCSEATTLRFDSCILSTYLALSAHCSCLLSVRAEGSADTFGAALSPDFCVNLRVYATMEYSVTVWRTPIRESKEVLYLLTYRREWIQDQNCWRGTLVRQQRENVPRTQVEQN